MSSEMRVTDEQVWAAVCAWRDVYDAEYIHSGSTMGNDEQAMRAALEAALLARTEAGADGVDTFAEWLATEMPAGTVIGNPAWWANRIARQYRVRSGVTHPQDASVDAELSELRRVLNKLADYWIAITRDKDVAHRDRAIIDAYDKGLTKCATELRAAMQAKEAK